jgi:HEAT repeat protein
VQEIATALNTLKMGDFQSRWDIAKQLEDCGEVIVSPLLNLLKVSDADPELQWFIAKILASLRHPDAILALSQLLEHSDEDVSSMAVQGLAKMGTDAIDQLSNALKDPTRQMTGLRALTQMHHRPEVVPLLLEVSQMGSAEARSLAFEALDQFIDPRISPLLLQGLTDVSAEVRKAAIASLAVRTQDNSAIDLVERLMPALNDADLGVVTQAAKALGRLGTDRGAIALTQKCSEPNLDPTLHQTLIQALGWIGSAAALKGLMETWQMLAQQTPLPELLMQEILSSTANFSGAAEWLLEVVRSPILQQSPKLRANAMLSLGRIGSPALLLLLIERLEDPDYIVRLHVLAALKQIDSELAHTAIQQRMADDHITPELEEGLAIALREW